MNASIEDEEINTYDVVSFTKPPLDWFMHRIQSTRCTSKLLTSLLNGSALAVSDGSYFPNERVGACAWIISSSDGSEWIQGGGVIPGPSGE